MENNQRDKVIEKVVFLYLNKRNYIRLDINDSVYFVENEGDEFATIRYDKNDGWYSVSYVLVSFLSRLTSTEESVIKGVIGRWVEDTLQMKVSNTLPRISKGWLPLKIPYQMKVKFNLCC
jgi:hypothetical protein